MEEALRLASTNCKASLYSIYDLALNGTFHVHVSGARLCFHCMKTLALAFAKGKIAPAGRQFLKKESILTFIELTEDNNDKKKKNGRPKKSSVSRKSKTIGVCFSEPELYTLRHRAKEAKLPLSVYCHDAILNGEIKEPLKKEELDILRSLANMGNNLNQLAKTAKFLTVKRLENEAQTILESIQNIINKLSDDWKNSKRKKL